MINPNDIVSEYLKVLRRNNVNLDKGQVAILHEFATVLKTWGYVIERSNSPEKEESQNMLAELDAAIKSMLDEDEEYRKHCNLMRGTEGAPAYAPRWNHVMLHVLQEVLKRAIKSVDEKSDTGRQTTKD